MARVPLVYENLPVEGDGMLGDMGLEMSSQCATCEHFETDLSCAAFPGGIPAEILLKGEDHSEPTEGQTNDVVYTPVT